MKCFFCKLPIVPQNGYFRTQMVGNNLFMHTKCKPPFFYSEDDLQNKDDPKPDWREQK